MRHENFKLHLAGSIVWISGWLWLDPVIALLVAANIVWTGWQLLQRSVSGLMDEAIPKEQIEAVAAVLDRYSQQGLNFHALRTRQAGRQAFITLHVLVPGDWTVQRGHDKLEQIETDIRLAVPFCHLTTHLEPIEDPASLADQLLEGGLLRTSRESDDFLQFKQCRAALLSGCRRFDLTGLSASGIYGASVNS